MEIMIENLSKNYGKKQALHEINMTIHQGMFGLIGNNGAGKTTLLRILSTLITKSSGNVTMNEIPIEKYKKIRGMIGYMPQNFSIYPDMNVYQAMEYFDMLSEGPAKGRNKKIQTLLSWVNMEKHSRMKVKALSGGMKQRLGVALAMLNDPKVLITDEPTAGLDPEERLRFRNLLCELAEDKIIILSTHIVDDIEATCKTVGVLNKGELLYHGTTDELANMGEDKVYTIELGDTEKVPEQYIVVSRKGNRVRILSDIPPVGNSEPCEPNIEDGYLELLKRRV